MRFKAITFDLDGTLLDTLEDIADSANAVLEHWGYPQHDLKTYKYLVGDGIENLVQRSLPREKRSDDFVDQCVQAMRAEYRQRWSNKTRPYEGIAELLNALRDRGVTMTILSNKPDDFTKLMVAALLPEWRFEVVLGANSELPKKPDPTAAVQIARDLNISVNEFLFVGDTSIDMKTAAAAGMYPVGVLWGFRTAEELAASGARVLLAKPLDLLNLLRGGQ